MGKKESERQLLRPVCVCVRKCIQIYGVNVCLCFLFLSEEDQFSFTDVELLPPPELYADYA